MAIATLPAQLDSAVAASASLARDSSAAVEPSQIPSPNDISAFERDAAPRLSYGSSTAANFAAVQFEFGEAMAGRQLLGATHGFENRVMPVRNAVEPLQQMASPSDTRRARLLVAMVPTTALETSIRTSERAASRYAEDRLNDQTHRFDARGDRVQMKF